MIDKELKEQYAEKFPNWKLIYIESTDKLVEDDTLIIDDRWRIQCGDGYFIPVVEDDERLRLLTSRKTLAKTLEFVANSYKNF